MTSDAETKAALRKAAIEAAALLDNLGDPKVSLVAAEMVVATLLIAYASDPLEAADFFHQRVRDAITSTLATTH